MIELQGIVKRYVLGDEEVLALAGVDLYVGRNEYVALIGPSGSGKSTLMNIIGCLDSTSEGRYILNGRDTSSLSEEELAAVRNREIGFVFQSFHLLPRQTALQNVIQPLVYRRMPPAERRERAVEALRNVGLGDRLDFRPNQLSGGQRQRVAVARALVGEPSILLADEPTGNLDSRTSAEIMSLFDALHAQGQAVFVVTHEPDIAAHCRRTIRVFDGRVVEDHQNPARAA
ncbi:MAG: ABC transporter ATP-binding protein [Gammaproteobacteria bacterium]|nr:ABC transporter ATP-binding protein [Gammaproteobacteria bacterium]